MKTFLLINIFNFLIDILESDIGEEKKIAFQKQQQTILFLFFTLEKKNKVIVPRLNQIRTQLQLY